MQERADTSVAFSHMSVTAALSILALLMVAGWLLVTKFISAPVAVTAAPLVSAPDANVGAWEDDMAALASSTGLTATSSDPVSQASTGALAQIIGAYAGFQSQGGNSTAAEDELATSIGSSLSAPVPHETFGPTDVKTDQDTSYARMLKYRTDLQRAFQPLLSNKQSEFELFARYVATNDPSYLAQLSAAAKNYYAAASSTALVVAPADAAAIHLDLLNAMEQFGATLDSMVAHASDPLATTILLNDYNSAEGSMLSSFNALAQYEKSKTP
jgi:hypothetical protein